MTKTSPEQTRARLVRQWRHGVLTAYFARTEGMTAHFKDVLLKLATFYGPRGCFPSLETLADAARVSVKTVQRALAWAGSQGLLSWDNRTTRAGNRRVRTSNRYRLIVVAEQQSRAAAAWLGRATVRALRRFVSPMDRESKEANRNISTGNNPATLGRKYPEPHGPSLSPVEWVDLITSWTSPPRTV